MIRGGDVTYSKRKLKVEYVKNGYPTDVESRF